MSRTASIRRKTAETDIELDLSLDGSGRAELETGIGFFDHMLTLLAWHGSLDLRVRCSGDLHVDQHHSVEDIGICFGQALAKAAGDKKGITRYGWAALPMDEALILVSLDLSGRGHLSCDLNLTGRRIGEFDAELAHEFFRAVADNARMTLHIRRLSGENAHHVVEGAFKGFGRALAAAVARDGRGDRTPSTKGVL